MILDKGSVVWGLVVVVASSCGGDERAVEDARADVGDADAQTGADADAATDSDAEPSDPAERFALLADRWCSSSAEVFCDTADDCGCGAAPGFPDRDGCVGAFDAQCRAQLGEYRSAVLVGNAVVDLDAILPCVALLDSLASACTRIPGDTFFVDCPILTPPGGFGELPGEGAPCGEGASCARGLRCDSVGTCRVPGGVAAPCVGPTECLGTLSCVDGVCAEPDLTDDGQACASPEECSGDTGCLRGNARLCEAILPDSACQFDRECIATQFCNGASDTCEDRPASGACGNNAVCADGFACGGDPRECRPLPGAGSECADGSSGPVMCADGLACNNNICGHVPGLGDPCAIGTPACGPGLGCAFERDGSFCREPAPVGSPCQNDPTCASGLFCDFGTGTCQAFLARGDTCSDGNECGTGAACLPDANLMFRCADAPEVGGGCFLDECPAGSACKPVYSQGACVRRYCATIDF